MPGPPPSTSVTARSARIFPGRCTTRRSPPGQHAVRPWPKPVTWSASASSNIPAWDTSP